MRISFLISLMAFTVFFSGCGSSLPTSKGLNYIRLPKIPISVSRVSVVVSPFVREKHDLQTLPLSTMVQQWADDYWQATGGRCQIIFYIKDIDIREEALACKLDIKQWVQIRNSDIYKGKMTVSCQLVAPNGCFLGKTDISVTHEQHVPENFTLSQRKALWQQLYEGLINQLTKETTNHIPDAIRRINGDQ